MLKRPHYIALCAVVLFVLILLNLPDKTTSQLKLALGALFLPLLGLASSAHTLTEQTGNSVVPRRALLGQIDQLRSENHQLKLQVMQNAQAQQENNQLRAAVAWQTQAPWNLRLGRVILREPSNWWRMLTIDLGSREGVVPNLAVLTAEGLVGKTTRVSLNSSEVILLGDPNCKVSAFVTETKEHGIIANSSVIDSSVVDLIFLPPHSQVKPGQKVVTSGWGGVFRPGIVIGKILDARKVDFGISTEARVKLAADLDRVDEVFVMLP